MNFFFYDLETSGTNPRADRIMQFAGQRTDMDLEPVGKPVNILIKMTEDVLPEPEACLITGITPQKTIAEGITEAEFAKKFEEEISRPNTIFVGFNNIRFDDEFMRFLLYRNYRDPYEWQWKDGRSRWDLLDLTRMARALRPRGIEWPFAGDGKPSNRLELLSSANKLAHADAHDALSDVRATVAVAKLIKRNNLKLCEYLLEMRDKNKVKQLVLAGQPFVYTSGKYDNEFAKTTVVVSLGPHPDRQGALVYDLRYDPKEYIDLSPEKLAELWQYDKEKKKIELPVKALQYNRCPAIAPLGVLDKTSKKRLSINLETVKKHLQILKSSDTFNKNLLKALEIINNGRKDQISLTVDAANAEKRLYDEFIPGSDKRLSMQLIATKSDKIMDFQNKLNDARLKAMLLPYKARNFKKSLSTDEHKQWEAHRKTKLLIGGKSSLLAQFSQKLEALSKTVKSDEKKYILEELQLYGLGIRPED